MANKSPKPDELLPGEVIRHVPRTDIFVDYEWNVRSEADVTSETSDAVQDTTMKGEHHGEGTGLIGLALDLVNSGQDSPVVLRKVQQGKSVGGKKTDKPYELICGFRRYTAAEFLTQKFGDDKKTFLLKGAVEEARKAKRPLIKNTADGTILAVVRELTPVEARILNTKENTLRQNISTPDMVRRVKQFLREDKIKQTDVATLLGIDQSYVSRLSKIGNLPQPILDHWSGRGKLPGLPEAIQKRLTSREMSELGDACKDMPEGEIIQRYISTLNPPPPAEGPEEKQDRILAKVQELGTLIGVMVREGILENGSLRWDRILGPKKEGYQIDTGKANATKRGEYGDAMQSAFEEALKPPAKKEKTQKEKDEVAAN